MRKLPSLFLLTLLAVVVACGVGNNSNTWEEYADWREANDAWLEMKEQSGFYRKIVPEWDKSGFVLIHYFNDRTKTINNLSPLSTSTVDVKYHGRLYNDEPFDSSYLQTTYGDSIYRTQVNTKINGWIVALSDMRVGDTCEVIVPYRQGYGGNGSGSIKPYSHLIFGLKLVDIPYYETSSK
ncbi:MAG: FKBP-type peptidyl-prolyl cis-trans isomerase [Muribaculaceae bacterium]|nr:FKBP-type peptidyl-prolyl cis-trans isomerase [Muribaculaceae bacterium]